MKGLLASILALSATGTALAQGTNNANAIGMWRSDTLSYTAWFIANVPAGQSGNSVWAVLPPDVLTYFKPQLPGGGNGARELDFRGFEFKIVSPANPTGASVSHLVPPIELRRAIQAPSPNEGRYIPDTTPGGLFATFTGAANFVVAANTTGLGLSIRNFTLTTANAVPVPAGSPQGDGLCFRMIDYMKQFGSTATTPNSLMMAMVNTESGPTTGKSFSGQTSVAGGNLNIDQGGLEFAVTFLFEQSMIAPYKNVKQLAPGAAIPGAGTLPPAVIVGLTGDDGRGALSPVPGDVISFMVNSNFTDKLGPAQTGNVWVIPFFMYEGDIGAGPAGDPIPEDWVGNGGASQPSYIHPMSLQQWFEDVATAFGLQPGIGGLLNPSKSTLGLWLGVDLSMGLLNNSVLANSFALGDVTNGPAFAGPETSMYAFQGAPAGTFSRNLVRWNSTIVSEHKSLQVRQRGYSPVVPLANGFVGIGEYPIGVPQLLGQGFYLTAWVLDLASPVTVTPAHLIDMTNVLKMTL